MVVLWVFPCMLLIAMNSMTMWTLTGGILGEAYKFMLLVCLNPFLGPWVFLAMIFLFIVNLIVVSLVAREFFHEVSEETHSEGAEEEEKKTSELPLAELTTEKELASERSGQEGSQENRSQATGTEEGEKTVTGEEGENAKGPSSTPTDEEVLKEDESGEAQKKAYIEDSKSSEEGYKEVSPKLPEPQESGETTKGADLEKNSTGASCPKEPSTEKPEMQFYQLKAALTAMWLPAVVGDRKNLFLTASLSTLITKILMLLVSVVLAYFFQENIYPHPFVLWSRVGKMFNEGSKCFMNLCFFSRKKLKIFSVDIC